MKKKNNNIKLCRIEFFNNDKSLGIFNLAPASDELYRRMVALDHDIKKWTHYVVDNGRFFGVRLNKNYFLAGHGKPVAMKLGVAESTL